MANKKVYSVFLAFALFWSLTITSVKGSTTGKFYVDQYPVVGDGNIYEPNPPWNETGHIFNVTVLVSDIVDCQSYSFKLRWYGDVLFCRRAWAEDPGPKTYNSVPSAYAESQSGYVTNPTYAYDGNGLTSADFAVPAYMGDEYLYVNGNDSARTGWTAHGTAPYLDAVDSSNVTTTTGDAEIGDFTFQDPGYTTYPSTITIYVEIYSQTDGDDDVDAYIHDGTSWSYAGRVSPDQGVYSWRVLDVSSILDTKAKITDAKMYLKKVTDGAADNVTVDCARLKVSLPGGQYLQLKTLSIPAENYHIMAVHFKLNYSVTSLNNGAYRILYRVGSAERTLEDWTSANRMPTVKTWQRVEEPDDGEWSWTNVTNIQLDFQTTRTDYTSTGGTFKAYEFWVEVEYASRPYVNFYKKIPGCYYDKETYFTRRIFNTPDAAGNDDYIRVTNTLLAEPIGMNGDGLLVIIEFRVESVGRSGLLLFEATGVDSFSDPIEVTLGHGNFANISWHDLGEPGDVDGDHDVDIADLFLIAKAMGTDPSYPSGTGWGEWNPNADINGDSKVNIFDLSIAASYYGSS